MTGPYASLCHDPMLPKAYPVLSELYFECIWQTSNQFINCQRQSGHTDDVAGITAVSTCKQ